MNRAKLYDLRKLFLGMFFIGSLHGMQSSNQTYLFSSPPGKGSYWDESGWKPSCGNVNSEKQWQASWQVIYFCSHSVNGLDLARYFGSHDEISVGYNINLDKSVSGENLVHDSIPHGFLWTYLGAPEYFILANDVNNNPVESVVNLNPAVTITGVPPSLPPAPFQPLATTLASLPAGSVVEGPLTVSTNPLQPSINLTSDQLGVRDLNVQLAISDFIAIAKNRSLKGTVTLRPKSFVRGFRLIYAAIYNDWLIKIDVPLIKITHNLGVNISNARPLRLLNKPAIHLADVLNGTYSQLKDSDGDAQNLQKPLLYSRMSNKDQSKTGVGDVDLVLGRRLWSDEACDAGIYIKFGLPSGSKSKPEHLFSPSLGRNGHLFLAIGGQSSLDIWQDRDWSITALVDGSLGYYCPRHQMRTLGAHYDSGLRPNWDYLQLVGQINATQPFEPLANLTTVSVRVQPGFQMDSMVSLGLVHDNIMLNVGCNIMMRQDEKVSLKNWNHDGAYTFVNAQRARTDMPLLLNPRYVPEGNTTPITKLKLDLNSASTPGFVLGTIWGSCAWCYRTKRTPIWLSLGFGYDRTRDNSTIQCWTLWGKVVLNF